MGRGTGIIMAGDLNTDIFEGHRDGEGAMVGKLAALPGHRDRRAQLARPRDDCEARDRKLPPHRLHLSSANVAKLGVWSAMHTR